MGSHLSILFTSRVSGQGYRNGPVCVCVCPCVNTLVAEALHLWSRNLVQGLTLMISRTSSMVKVIGQRSRSQGQKMWLQWFSDFSAWIHNAGLMWCHGMMPRHHVTSHDVMWRHMRSCHDVTAWCHDVINLKSTLFLTEISLNGAEVRDGGQHPHAGGAATLQCFFQS